jgi:alkylation response protein AidB-like acyl-CoA dehydrogenase
VNFAPTFEQTQLEDSLDRLLGDQEVPSHRGGTPDADKVAAGWRQLAELGVLGLSFSEDAGGSGLGPFDLMYVSRTMGRRHSLLPFLSSVILGGTAVQLAGSESQQAAILADVAAGAKRLAWAHEEPDRAPDAPPQTAAKRAASGEWTVSGQKLQVLDGAHADLLVVSACLPAGLPAAGQVGLFLVDSAAKGLLKRAYSLHDGRASCDLQFDDVRAQPLGSLQGHEAIVKSVLHAGIAAICAEAVGAMEGAYALTLDYVKVREQFGHAIGSYQVVQHRVVDMLVALEQARSMMIVAAAATELPPGTERERDLHAAKYIVGNYGRQIGQQSVQLHGAIGLTEEYALGAFVRILLVTEQLLGNRHEHLAALARLPQGG